MTSQPVFHPIIALPLYSVVDTCHRTASPVPCCQIPGGPPSQSGSQCGCCGESSSTTPSPSRIQKAPPVRSWCWCGPSSRSSSWHPTRPTWQPSWSRSNTSTRCRGWATKRWVCEQCAGVQERARHRRLSLSCQNRLHAVAAEIKLHPQTL